MPDIKIFNTAGSNLNSTSTEGQVITTFGLNVWPYETNNKFLSIIRMCTRFRD